MLRAVHVVGGGKECVVAGAEDSALMVGVVGVAEEQTVVAPARGSRSALTMLD